MIIICVQSQDERLHLGVCGSLIEGKGLFEERTSSKSSRSRENAVSELICIVYDVPQKFGVKNAATNGP